VAAQHAADRARREADAELSQLALDAHAPPRAVFTAEPDDEVDELGTERRQPWEQPAEGGEDRPICRPVGKTAVQLAFEDADLMAEHQKLDVVVGR
jgi:hypothetical protein